MSRMVYVINESTLVSDDDVLNMVAAGQVQVSRDFAPIHDGKDAVLVFVPSACAPTQVPPREKPATTLRTVSLPRSGDTPVTGGGCDPRMGGDSISVPQADGADPGEAWLLFLDHSDQAGALGYHDLTPGGEPIGYIGVADDQANGSSLSCTFSHELLEMLLDPFINEACYDPNSGSSHFYAKEACDACEDDSQGYNIGGVLVSDFVTPAWFQPALTGPYDFMGAIPAPFALLPGGYIGVFIPGYGWTQNNAKTPSKFAHLLTPRMNSRRARRTRMHAGRKPHHSRPVPVKKG